MLVSTGGGIPVWVAIIKDTVDRMTSKMFDGAAKGLAVGGIMIISLNSLRVMSMGSIFSSHSTYFIVNNDLSM
jgi:hypothetical protein